MLGLQRDDGGWCHARSDGREQAIYLLLCHACMA
jgi:hypothetical protein